MDRTKFYSKVTVNGIDQLDYLDGTPSSFKVKRRCSYYRTDIHDVGRPDLISFEVYGTVRYWWIICIVNKIMDPLQGIAEGDLLKIPHILDIGDFYRQYRIR